MATVLPMRPNTNSTGTSTSTSSTSRHRRDPSLSSVPSNRSNASIHNETNSLSAHRPTPSASSNPSSARSFTSSTSLQLRPHRSNGTTHLPPAVKRSPKPVKSQYPASSTEKHVEYILVASFDIDRGSVMEHQYPGPVGGDEHMLAELMLPDQTHLRSQDWTIFFLHKDAEDLEEEGGAKKRTKRRKLDQDGQAGGGAESEDGENADGDEDDAEEEEEEEGEDDEDAEESSDDENSPLDGPPLVYVLNLVNTKQDNTVKRGAIVKAMAICTPHPFLHIYKPLLLIALEQYFANPVIDTLASLYNAVNSMDLSLMPRLNLYEQFILQSLEVKDLFIEKFEAMIAQRMATTHQQPQSSDSPSGTTPALPSSTSQHPHRYGLPRDTHSFDSLVHYANIPIPIRVPVALSPETVGDFSLTSLITTFSRPHSTSPIPFTPTHPHLTTAGSTTHPIIVLLNALLTQKRIIFLGHNLPSSSVADAVLGACALASGGLLRGFTRHAFPYTDLTKIDDLLQVPGFIAGVTNPAFAHKSEWWDLLCDLSTGRMRISNRIENAPLTEGVQFFHHPQSAGGPSPVSVSAAGGMSAIAAAGASLSAGLGGSAVPTSMIGGVGDATGDAAFMASVLKAIEERHGENAVRSKFRRWVLKFTRLAAAFEETVYGASALHIQPETVTPSAPFAGAAETGSPAVLDSPLGFSGSGSGKVGEGVEVLPAEVTGHGYVWPSASAKQVELAANATRIEGWRNTRSYYNFIQDLAVYYVHRPVKSVDLQHLHDKLSKLRLTPTASADIYLAICAAVWGDREIDQLLAVVVNSSGVIGSGGGGEGGKGGLFYLALGLFHPKREVREAVAGLLGRVREHEAGRHFWEGMGRFAGRAFERVWEGMVREGEGEG